MLNKNTKTKIITSLLLTGIILSSSISVLASESNPASITDKTPTCSEKGKWNKIIKHHGFPLEDFKAKLDTLVRDGTITEAQSSQITDYLKTKQAERNAERDKVKSMTEEQRQAYFDQKKASERPAMFKELVDNKVITQAQADAVKKVLSFHKNKIKINFREKLSSAVTSGTITQVQADKITNYLETIKSQRKAEMDKVKNMTEEQRKAYFDQRKTTAKPDIFKDLVAQKIVSQSEADALKKLFFPEGKRDYKR